MIFSLFNDHHPQIPSGKHTKNYGKLQFLMGKLTISMAIFNSKLLVITTINGHFQQLGNKLPEGSWMVHLEQMLP